jgi:hypothetical protein
MLKRGLVLFILLIVFQTAHSQAPVSEAVQDSVKAPASQGEELVLDQIDIQGQVEKPGVIVIPSRVDPDIDQLELNRSFDKELKNGVEAVPQSQEALEQVEGVDSIKKAVERKRN